MGDAEVGLRDPRSIAPGRGVLFGVFGEQPPLRRAPGKDGERPYIIARVGINRSVPLQAATSAAALLKVVAGPRFAIC
jgi:hypothetical protein